MKQHKASGATAVAAMLLTLAAASGQSTLSVPIRDLVQFDHGPVNHVFGYGLVIGLDGSGDSRQAIFAVQSVKSMLRRMGVDVGDENIQTRNVAAVIVTASLKPFGRAGDAVDVQVSAIGDARTLQGGMLLQTPLQDATGVIRAMAQGPLSLGGFNVTGGASTVQKNHASVARIPSGGVLTANVEGEVAAGGIVSLQLLNADYTTAVRIVDTLEESFGQLAAQVMDPGRVTVRVPDEYLGRETLFIARLEALKVRPEVRARVVVNERTGTVVVGGNVRLMPVAIAHGGLRIEINTTPVISQPAPFTETPGASTVVVPDTQVSAEEEPQQLTVLEPGDSVQELVRVLNTLGVTPRDLIAIFQALKEAGALLAELEIM